MLKNTVNKRLLNILRKINNDNFFKDYYLVGGTALSLQIGHRISEDLDFFSFKGLENNLLYDHVRSNICKDIEITNQSGRILQLYSKKENIKIDFVNEPYKPIENILNIDGIKLLGLNDISAMKIAAIGQRGNQAKDFVDVYFLLNYMSMDKIMENFKKRCKITDILHYIRSLIYFDDVKNVSWEEVKYIGDKLTPNKVKAKIVNEVKKYKESIDADCV